MRKVMLFFKFMFHSKASNHYLKLSEKTECEEKQEELFKKAYYHNNKYLENKIQIPRA